MGKHVAVLMGGFSSERPVSLASGKACAAALETAGYTVTTVDVDRNVAETLARLRPDVAFNALHGPFGEDGTIQGILEYLEIPYTHSGVLASALAMHKERAKIVAKAAGVPVAEAKLRHRLDAAESHVLPPPYVIKPVAEGSSFGVLIVREDQPHPPQQLYGDDWPYGDIVMIERFIAGYTSRKMLRRSQVIRLTVVFDSHYPTLPDAPSLPLYGHGVTQAVPVG